MTESMEKEAFVVEKFEPVSVPPAFKTIDGVYFLSNLDLYQNLTISNLFCYKSETRTSNNNACEVIKQALAEVLVHYYPFAGRLGISSEGKLVVNCTGEGAIFVEAVADCDLDLLGNITKLNFGMLGKLVHTYPISQNILEIPLLTVQVTRFKCGGFVLGVANNHCMADGIAINDFLSSWAQIARGSPMTIFPFLDRSILSSRQPPKNEFPHQEFYEIKDVPKSVLASKDEEFVRKSFCLKDKKLNHLRTLAMEDGKIEKCSNFTLVAAYTWRVMTEALQMEADQQTKLVFAVELRSKFKPPLPKGYFGNAVFHPCCLCSAGELTSKPFSFAVKLVQDAIKSVTEEYVRSAIDHYEVKGTNPYGAYTLFISAWSKLGFLDNDFGWGKPTQSTLGNPGPNLCFTLPQSEDKKDVNFLMVMASSLMNSFEGLIET
ncbi:omega-hydroxypalmitate O-feruloyl transferase-like [Macadamia integrifolia]|uniref:omega-hydroxypalmitate O-feruloyl transferase-like n=1 Tax=Macadamia integrifolia TaxID=60698 RepID=UPI001C4EA424|nr:omega-hydroxypalmitate O-feruloyl transferase-like [Macadamia integrifolia]XP_042499428.1 omega-hydroxypalmitate O-feruloyl transferase-like [Macadamia integrifolia]XP_042499429.1 omega-hydroxypalmitate O-feruloyl transferase-like [Macadamia integrifolia]